MLGTVHWRKKQQMWWDRMRRGRVGGRERMCTWWKRGNISSCGTGSSGMQLHCAPVLHRVHLHLHLYIVLQRVALLSVSAFEAPLCSHWSGSRVGRSPIWGSSRPPSVPLLFVPQEKESHSHAGLARQQTNSTECFGQETNAINVNKSLLRGRRGMCTFIIFQFHSGMLSFFGLLFLRLNWCVMAIRIISGLWQ